MGIRTAARRKEGAPPRMPIATLLVQETARAIKALIPEVKRLHLVGSRLRHKYARDLDFVAVSRKLAGRNQTLKVGNLSVNLFFSAPEDVEPAILEFGLGFDIMRWKKKAISMGYHLNRYGLWRGKVLVSQKMAQIASILGLPLKPFLVYTLQHPL